MPERTDAVTMKGNPLTLVGAEVKVGDPAPDFTVLDNDLSPATLSDYRGKVCIVSSVPSLDTPVCDMETRRFNTEADRLGGDVAVLTVSMDLPFAQKRWCGAAGVENVVTLSDHRDADTRTVERTPQHLLCVRVEDDRRARLFRVLGLRAERAGSAPENRDPAFQKALEIFHLATAGGTFGIRWCGPGLHPAASGVRHGREARVLHTGDLQLRLLDDRVLR